MDGQSTTNSPPTAEQKGKMAAKEPRGINTNSRKQEDKYTRPPRISFGLELEFLVATHPRGVKSDDDIPDLAPVTDHMSGTDAASEPVLSTLHCPTRSFAHWSKSIRRCDGIDLTNGETAETALYEACMVDIDYIPRYLGRTRKLGEAPVASKAKLRQHFRQAKLHDDSTYWEPEFESDDSDYECDGSKPFQRPRRTKGTRRYTYNWKGQLRGELGVKNRTFHGTVESRLAGGSLDAESIVIWIKIQCCMLEWARDADPSQLMRILGNLSRHDLSKGCTYDVLDFLKNLGMYTEIKHCQERLLRAEEAWFECMMLKLGGEWLDDGETRPYIDWTDLTNRGYDRKKEVNGLYGTEQGIHW
ncbi:hypothetical protein F53441_9764 [Fusarium austroafricanum]|uniref:Uncharacterized protein n=1 Tax=Fusarium austroafricanum TaxID=2364996 RepID=A0A8H4KBV0_9HYPO|nr:hypothetical protein F53441_9764 [Fusarium austroafricanum]